MNDFDASEKYDKEQIKKVQNVLMVMANHVHRILEEHNIKYFIAFGTLLGAVRHQGFIPWDDDFDVFLFEEEYEEAIYWLRKELPSWMIVHDRETDPIYWPYWSRIRDLNSETYAEAFPDDNNYKYKGINLDLYKLKKAPKNKVDLHLLQENKLFYERKYDAGLLDEQFYINKIKELDDCISKENDIICNSCEDGKELYYFVTIIKKIEEQEIFPLKKYNFENCEFWGPNNADSILRNAYGNYMEPLPFPKRKPHYSEVKFFETDFVYE